MSITVIIPSRNEMFLKNTIEDLLAHSESDLEIIAVLDGQWGAEPIPQHENVNVIYVPESVGQRGGGMLAAKLAQGKYIVKCDAHCSFEQGWDKKMLEFFKKVGDNVTAVPVMNNLHAFNWKCKECGWTKYQSPTPARCESCQKESVEREMIWQSRRGVHSVSYCFDSAPHFQYFQDYKSRTEYQKMRDEHGYTETMGLQGSFFMMTRDKFFELLGIDYGSWGNQGLEVACATWLSGGRVLVNHKTWYAHMFRTQGGDFGFPYHMGGNEVQRTKNRVWETFRDKKHPKQIHPVSWLVKKFWPVGGWDEQALKKLEEIERL